jgi:hypothetical protein
MFESVGGLQIASQVNAGLTSMLYTYSPSSKAISRCIALYVDRSDINHKPYNSVATFQDKVHQRRTSAASEKYSE